MMLLGVPAQMSLPGPSETRVLPLVARPSSRVLRTCQRHRQTPGLPLALDDDDAVQSIIAVGARRSADQQSFREDGPHTGRQSDASPAPVSGATLASVPLFWLNYRDPDGRAAAPELDWRSFAVPRQQGQAATTRVDD